MNDVKYKFSCNVCNYSTIKKANYDRHLSSSKHKSNINCLNYNINGETNEDETNNINDEELNDSKYNCKLCKKNFNSNNSLWKHNNRKHPPMNDEDKINKLTNLVVHVVEQNTYLSHQICQLAKRNTNNTNINGNNNATVNSNNITNSNNRFNINVYLNETCRNAMNINEFVDSIQVGIEDLEETSRLGFVDGISRIIINNLNKIETPNRPIHCSDSKRMTIYVKSENKWNKNEDNKDKLKTMIQHVAGKNMKQIYEWQKLNPDYCDPLSKCSDTYQKMLFQIMNGDTVEESNDNINKIIKNIAKETIIAKNLETFCT
jgi:hypothetical protein